MALSNFSDVDLLAVQETFETELGVAWQDVVYCATQATDFVTQLREANTITQKVNRTMLQSEEPLEGGALLSDRAVAIKVLFIFFTVAMLLGTTFFSMSTTSVAVQNKKNDDLLQWIPFLGPALISVTHSTAGLLKVIKFFQIIESGWGEKGFARRWSMYVVSFFRNMQKFMLICIDTSPLVQASSLQIYAPASDVLETLKQSNEEAEERLNVDERGAFRDRGRITETQRLAITQSLLQSRLLQNNYSLRSSPVTTDPNSEGSTSPVAFDDSFSREDMLQKKIDMLESAQRRAIIILQDSAFASTFKSA
jgi:hypothetical protein